MACRATASLAIRRRTTHYPLIVQQAFFSSQNTTTFFSYTSGRAQRRRRLRDQRKKRLEQPRKQQPTEEDEYVSGWDILFPNPYKGETFVNENRFQRPKNFQVFRAALQRTMKEYRYTWQGFLTSRGFLVEDDEPPSKKIDTQPDDLTVTAREKQKEVTENAQRNAKFLEEEAYAFRKEVHDRTGIKNTDDLKRVAGEMMQLASECVKEFMSGYRKGRDDEVEKMLTQYFEDLEKEAEEDKSTRRRRPKRRVIQTHF